MTSAFWSFEVSAWAVAGGGVFLAGILWLSLRLLRRSGGVRGLAAVECLRWLAALLLALTLFRPERVRLTRLSERPPVVVLCDRSGSLATRDVPGADGSAWTRAAWLETQLVARFWAPLEEKYRVSLEDFGRPPEPGTNGVAPDAGTDIGAALDEAMRRHPGLRAVVLLSDGDWNAGQSPVGAATRLAARDAPVFAAVVGSEQYLPDLELRSVAAPAYALLDEHLSLPFTIQSRLPRDVRTTVTLEGPDGRVAERAMLIPAMAQCQQTMVMVPRKAGNAVFTLKVPVEKDEAFMDNNEKAFSLSLRTEILKVLIVESLPRWEFRFLRNAFERDPGVDAQSLLLHPDLPGGVAAGGGRNYLAAFPSREELTRYDAVFLGDVGIGPKELSLEQAEWLKGLVEQQGSGLIFLPGPRGRQGTLAGSPLGDLLPVELDAAGAGVSVASRLESHLSLTHLGRDHLLTMLAATPAENEVLWKGLPGFWWHAPARRARPGSDVLAVHAETRNSHGRLPLLVTRPAGSGKTLFLGTDSAWRWRRGVEDVHHYRFWGQVVRWMAHQRHLAHQEGIRFFFTPEAPQRGERVFLHATVLDASGYPIQSGRVHASIQSGDGAAEQVELAAEPGGWGVFTGSFLPRRGGLHAVKVACEAAGRQVAAEIPVQSPTREIVGRPARADVLRELAAITQGRCGGGAELAELIQGIRLLPQARPAEERFRLWCHPLWLALLALVLAAYWVGRKLAGMI